MPNLKRTVYIGLGGTGLKTLLKTKKAFIETYGEVPPFISFLAIDADQNEYLKTEKSATHGDIKFEPAETINIGVNGANSIYALNQNNLTWLHPNNGKAIFNLVNGCKAVRTNGRFIFTFHQNNISQLVFNALNKVRQLQNTVNSKYGLIGTKVDVIMFFSIAGGTGAGTFIDMAYLIRDVLNNAGMTDTSNLIGYVVLPDIYEAQLPLNARTNIKPNGYASLLELDYLMHQNPGGTISVAGFGGQQRTLKGRPFDALFAVSNTTLTSNSIINDSKQLAEILSSAAVVSAGEISGGISSLYDNITAKIVTQTYVIGNKESFFAAIGLSQIVLQSDQLNKLYELKYAELLASNFLTEGNGQHSQIATAWIDDNKLRENNGHDDVIDSLLSLQPTTQFVANASDRSQTGTTVQNVENYKNTANRDINVIEGNLNPLKARAKKALVDLVDDNLNKFGPRFTAKILASITDQFKNGDHSCLGEMQTELKDFESSTSLLKAAVESGVQELRVAEDKFFGKQKAVNDALSNLSSIVQNYVLNEREIARRNNAISFYNYILNEIRIQLEHVADIEKSLTKVASSLSEYYNNLVNTIKNGDGDTFKIDLTEPYIEKVTVHPDEIHPQDLINGKVLSTLSSQNKDIDSIRNLFLDYASTHNKSTWHDISVIDAFNSLSPNVQNKILEKAISYVNPLIDLDWRGHVQKALDDEYYYGVPNNADRASQNFIQKLSNNIPNNPNPHPNLVSIGSKNRIIIYHQYSLFPTFAINGVKSYETEYNAYQNSSSIAYSCHIDENWRNEIARSGFQLMPVNAMENANSVALEVWVKGLIFGQIKRKEDGTYIYRDEQNDDAILDDYWTDLSQYRDDAFNKLKPHSIRLQNQFEQYIKNKATREGVDAINAILADAKQNYLNDYSLNRLSNTQLNDYNNQRIKELIKAEVKYVKQQLEDSL